jgi:hypothetical protein
MKLTAEQIRTFDEEGYLFFPNCFSEEEIALMRIEGEQILAADRKEIWREKTGAPRTAFAAHTFNEVFRLLAHHPRLVEPLEQVFGEPVYVHQFKLNAKAAFQGDVWQWHQDYGTWARDDGMPEPRAMNIAVFLDDVFSFNGALMLIPKSHKHGTLAVDARRRHRDASLQGGRAARPAGYRCSDRPSGVGPDVPREPRPRLGAEHHPLSAQDHLSDAVRGLQPHHQIHAPGLHRTSRLHADRGGRR